MVLIFKKDIMKFIGGKILNDLIGYLWQRENIGTVAVVGFYEASEVETLHVVSGI